MKNQGNITIGKASFNYHWDFYQNKFIVDVINITQDHYVLILDDAKTLADNLQSFIKASS